MKGIAYSNAPLSASGSCYVGKSIMRLFDKVASAPLKDDVFGNATRRNITLITFAVDAPRMEMVRR